MNQLGDILQQAAAQFPNRPAVIHGPQCATYGDLWHQVASAAGQLREILGGTVGNIAVAVPRSVDYLMAYFTVVTAGGVVVPLDPQMTTTELQATAHYCDLQAVVTTEASVPTWSSLDVPPVVLSISDGRLQSHRIKQCVSQRRVYPDAAVMLPTSGTLGNPKRAVHTHRGLLWNARAHARSLALTPEDRCVVAMPPYLGYCNTAQLLCHLQLGGTLVLFPGLFAPRQFFNLVRQHGITTFTGVPSMIQYLLDHAYSHPLASKVPSLRYICFGGSPVRPDWADQVLSAFPGTEVVQTYGQTEAGPRITTMCIRAHPEKRGSVGQPLPEIKVRVVDSSGADVCPGSTGEVLVSSPSVMAGYYRRDEDTSAVRRGEWLVTGDLGHLDADGFLYITGRKKNLIIRAGCNVQPGEVEECLQLHPAVRYALVLGEEEKTAGEQIVAFVVLRPEVDCSAAELLTHCRSLVSAYKLPSRIEFVPDVIRTYNGKLKRVRPTTASSEV